MSRKLPIVKAKPKKKEPVKRVRITCEFEIDPDQSVYLAPWDVEHFILADAFDDARNFRVVIESDKIPQNFVF